MRKMHSIPVLSLMRHLNVVEYFVENRFLLSSTNK